MILSFIIIFTLSKKRIFDYLIVSNMSCNHTKTSVRVSGNSHKAHHHNEAKCKLIDDAIKSLPEIVDFMEPFDPKKPKLCWHNCLCYEVECGFAHTYLIEARKKIKKAVAKEEKLQKIKGEVAKLGNEGFVKEWGDY